MRNLKRLEYEIRLLEQAFGYQNVAYEDDGSWIKILNYSLPQKECKYNLGSITVLIIIPEAYDNASVFECYIDKDVRLNGGREFERLPHTHDRKYKNQGYQWLCFEDTEKFVSLIDFVKTLKLYFTNPLKYPGL